MTPAEVRAAVEMIRQLAADNGEGDRPDHENAHSEEDGLYQALLEAIAKGDCADPAGCAREALKTQEIEFYRWCS